MTLNIQPLSKSTTPSRLLRVLLCLTFFGLMVLAMPVHAATIAVTTTDDEYDENAGACSLREAVVAANTNTAFGGCDAGAAGIDTITLPAGTYELTTDGDGEDEAATGDLDILEELIIEGADEATTIIDGQEDDRIFHVIEDPFGPDTSLTMSNVTIQNGEVEDEGGGIFASSPLTLTNVTLTNNVVDSFSDHGGAIFHQHGTLALINCTISNNEASASGGGVYSSEQVPNRTITGSTFSNNVAEGNEGGGLRLGGGSLMMSDVTIEGNEANNGGGMYSSAEATLNNVIFRNNEARGTGGGGFYHGTISNAATLTNVTFEGNQAISKRIGEGGGIRTVGELNMSNSTITGNSAYDGGGFANSVGEVTLENVTISNNQAILTGGGIYQGGLGELKLSDSLVINNNTNPTDAKGDDAGGIYIERGTAEIERTTISGNTAGGDGGGIQIGNRVGGVEVTIVDSTISNNTVLGLDEGIRQNTGEGAGIRIGDAEVELINVTIDGNQGLGKNDDTEPGSGGGLAVVIPSVGDPGTVTLNNVTISNNSATGGGHGILNETNLTVENTLVHNGDGSSNCIFLAETPITSDGNNLESGDTCGFASTGDLTNQEPLLGGLQDNDGPTLTRALLVGSPAIDAGNDSSCENTDQRGIARPIDGNSDGTAACDIGAYEMDLERADLILSTTTDPETVIPSEQFSYILSLQNQGPADASNIALTDTLPAEVTFVSASTGCNQSAGVVTCTQANLAAGATADFNIVVTAPASKGTLENNVQVAGTEPDPNLLSNNQSSSTMIGASSMEIYLPLVIR